MDEFEVIMIKEIDHVIETVGHYDRDCDDCLFDRHYCRLCQDVVGHGHAHDSK